MSTNATATEGSAVPTTRSSDGGAGSFMSGPVGRNLGLVIALVILCVVRSVCFSCQSGVVVPTFQARAASATSASPVAVNSIVKRSDAVESRITTVSATRTVSLAVLPS